MDDVAIIIPAYKPDSGIMNKFIKSLKREFSKIVVINDGSGEAYEAFFDSLRKQDIVVLDHSINLGKGRGIKTGFNYVLKAYKDVVGSVTADCDGQHDIKDILACARKLKEDPSKLVIGCRNFDESQVPFKSRYGNKITRFVLSAFVSLKVTDTQSGLRAFGRENMKIFLEVSGERYDYETNMIIECREKDIDIVEIPISTIYIRNNSLSHFDAIKDSLKIYKLFIKYIFASLSSFLIDLGLFIVFVKVFPEIDIGPITEIVIATILARIISSIYNFIINAKVVFRKKHKSSVIKYFILAVTQMLVSAFVVSRLFRMLHISSTILKLIVDTIIFVVNFIIQRDWVFKSNG